MTTVTFRNPFSDGQAQSGTPCGPSPRIICPVKALKDVGYILGWNAYARILHHEVHILVAAKDP
jgi:hypothetical protein